MERIKITHNSLRDAGWLIVEVGDHGPGTPKREYNRYEKWKRETDHVCDQLSKPLFYDRIARCFTQLGTEVQFMDELK